KKSSMSI
ncbi:hypothetical protein MK338_05880, partial [Streptococcus vestibularis]|nr:hypothetical protein [Streptococcus vestibularis]